MSTVASRDSSDGLHAIIGPEVFCDEFFDAIRDLARTAAIDTVLEIGSSSGDGSTLAWVQGLGLNPRKPELYCLELSRVRHEALEQRWKQEGFVKCFQGSSVELDQYPSEAEVERFYHTVETSLCNYPLEDVLGWLRRDKAYIQEQNVRTGLIREIKRAQGIEHFGAVLIDGSQFTGNAELDEVYGAEFILLDDVQTFKCHEAHQRLLRDPAYELIMENPRLRHGFSIFRRRRRARFDPLPVEVPVHYFTIVLNGEPFIRHHIEVLKQLPFRWHWHVVEGAADLMHDSSWSVAAGGSVPEDQHRNGLSVDGTTAYLDQLVSSYPGQISIYRPPTGRLWEGKIEMVSEPLKRIFEDCVLWEVDVDELWTVEQFVEGRKMFLEHPEKSAAKFWCDFFVGEKLVIASRHCYAQNPAQEWLRAWSFQPGMKWESHAPPVLSRRQIDGTWRDVASGSIFGHAETASRGLVFQHFAYATEAQAAFKERYYGYAGAVKGWQRLQAERQTPLLLRDFFPWVTDHTEVDAATNRNIIPLARRNGAGQWEFTQHSPPRQAKLTASPTIVVDGIFFQLNNTGIARLWIELLREWVRSGIAEHVWLLDRDGTAPDIPGIRRHRVRRLDTSHPGPDSFMLQDVCDALGADVLVSTYYSCAISTPCVAMIYDMIPERLNLPPGDWQWEHKKHSLTHSRHFVCISEATANDLRCMHPEIAPADVTVAHPAAPHEYKPASADDIAAFRERHGIYLDYIILSGDRIGIPVGTQGYKNAALAFRAWSLLPKEERDSLLILCTGGNLDLEESLRLLAPDAEVRVIRFSEEDLALAFSGAVALVYPSLYEGFGLPVIEAMACGCPVITCQRASLVEVAGDAAVFVNPWDPHETASAITTLRHDAKERSRLIAAGFAQAARFSFARAASSVASTLFEVASRPATPEDDRLAKMWAALRHMQTSASTVRQLTDQLEGQQHAALAAREALSFMQKALVENQQNLTDTQKSLKESRNALKEAQKALKELQKAKKRSEKQLKQMREKPSSPLKRIWNRLRRRKGQQ
ncbi:glycosyltransferase involved in cell wall biosynthesis [Roseimicrobium gellanilyticum]|uniref:Glycosyltransferase involved in cell wall biosynthesis n=1 Tax=Roseimicrobium gellanilyticum TaxID=748857 RepID=A0A366H5F9_9BACT|nr:glycosyltransferase family 1 protein [Roseimicrobium gellanilyticum]RBP36658.1 glycosyltransferase involved in cell wall biosynthesis [Roseimicrobium gellanilyticum]